MSLVVSGDQIQTPVDWEKNQVLVRYQFLTSPNSYKFGDFVFAKTLIRGMNSFLGKCEACERSGFKKYKLILNTISIL